MSFDLCTPYQCNVCLMLKVHGEKNDPKPYQSLLSCSGCQFFKYCSTSHQKIDWPIHGEFCKAVQKIKKVSSIRHPFYVAGKPTKREDLEQAIIRLKYLLTNVLKRNLKSEEEELTSFPVFCPVCFKFEHLKTLCSKCLSQAYCTQQHKEIHRQEHEKDCDLLRMYYCLYKVLPVETDFNRDIKGDLENLENMNLIQAFEKVFMVELNKKPYQDLKSYQLFAYAADCSCIMSICFALKQINSILKGLTEYRIFILGASVEAILWFREIHCKLFFLLYPSIRKLNIDFIGPELVETKGKEFEFTFMNLKRLVQFICYKGLFQDYCKYNSSTPHLIVSFNCGFSEFSETCSDFATLRKTDVLDTLYENGKTKVKNTWFHGLIKILQTINTPIVFTSFTEQEAKFDYAALQNAAITQGLNVRIEQILKVLKNPFHDLRPLRQWYTWDKEEFYYRNGYIQAIRTHLEK